VRELTLQEIDEISGGRSAAGIAGDAILTFSGGFLGFCLSGGNPVGLMVGASLGHQFANAVVS
jgi:hypothetical protein